MDLEHRYFYEVCQTRNMTKAAKNLYISEPTLSTAIKKLEQKLGLQLFNRQTNPLTLTDAGQLFLNATNKIRLTEQDFNHQLQDYKKLKHQTLHVGTSQYFNSYYLPSVLKDFYRLYPDVNVSIIERNTQLLKREVKVGNVDIAIHCGKQDDSLRHWAVQSDKILLAIPKNFISDSEYQQARAFMVEHKFNGIPNFLKKLPFITLSPTNDLTMLIDQLCDQLNFYPHSILEAYQLETAFHMAFSGLGATFITKQIKNFFDSTDNLYYLNISSPVTSREYYAYIRNNAYQSNYMKQFIRLLKRK
ncbi:LysR family transcriptional regulator [Limosilactobacillus agrestis]|uniref:LysR family transcriptional regulator n=1 Tax=Limosilactobacillus agrestis TaxID=2759748 RepID=A0ABS8R9S7_9LACO|nr:LysR family transcriptional regulator [Limosilactobacillus agrestis]MCD7130240.1 LysR family transcriptional regulator [Limosilactobacillus agrestis]